MKFQHSMLLVLITIVLLSSCQASGIPATLLADGQTYTLATTDQPVPAALLTEAGITLGTNDRLLYLGLSIPLDQQLPKANSFTLTIRRAVALTLITADGTQILQTSAPTVGQALAEAGFTTYAADRLDPPAGTPIEAALSVSYQPSAEFSVTVDGTRIQIRSSAATVGQALAEAGIPLIGLDYAIPPESEPLPADGQLQVVRVLESFTLAQKSIPYGSRNELSADIEIDQQALLQGGQPGLSIARTRTRSEDGKQVSQAIESESIVRPPQDRIMGYGMKIIIRTTTVDGQTIEYWRALNLYSTYYIPCIPGTTKCWWNTASGKPVQKGVVAFVYPWYLLFGGEHLYVPGYGFATVEDNNGANTNAFGETYWIDLGYSQTDTVDWVNRYVTVYFLTPVPANPGYILP